MSSLAATQADGYYLPPEYYDSGQYKKKTKNQFANSKGHNQYEQRNVVRFELPYKGVCLGACQTSIGKGTRYNAQKVQTDQSYFTTPIWEFRMKCRNCQHPFVIRTNPQERGFDYCSGISIQSGQVDTEGNLESLPTDTALDRLDSRAQGKRKTLTEIEEIQQLQDMQAKTTLEDAAINATIRAGFRKDRKAKRLRKQQAAQVGWKDGMELLPTDLHDTVTAKSQVYGQPKHHEQAKFQRLRKSSIFSTEQSSSRKRRQKQRRTIAVTPVSSSTELAPSRVTSATIRSTSSPTTNRNSRDPKGDDNDRNKRTIPDTVCSANSNTTTKPTKKIILSSRVNSEPSANHSSNSKTTKDATTPPPAGGGLLDVLAGYGSDTSSSSA